MYEVHVYKVFMNSMNFVQHTQRLPDAARSRIVASIGRSPVLWPHYGSGGSNAVVG